MMKFAPTFISQKKLTVYAIAIFVGALVVWSLGSSALQLRDAPLSTDRITAQEQRANQQLYDKIKSTRETMLQRAKEPIVTLRDPFSAP